ncbi:BCCT family transporter [Kribbella turkmenica]|uniref:BCCT family transporter n=1 Tax=Kribbella turkmenica TaxID=2530375 RepID=A0A4R4XHL5_9ACTN|nr:BCCT family transporter [Kribbella turkmenica]TDD30478.1 BCCT family transporter [Kribbella turkmenica]
MSTTPENQSTPDRAERFLRLPADRPVLATSAALALGFILWGIVDNKGLAGVAGDALAWVIKSFGWLFVLASAGFVVLALVLACSRYGRIRLGRDDERPEFKTVSWITMMFSAGMGIGLMFYGVAEPLSHLSEPPMGLAEPNSQKGAELAMQYSFFHWAFHPWAMYAVIGLALAYFSFRHGRANLISSTFFPLLGKRSEGNAGRAIDSFAILATLFGSATSLGLGALQINSGLNQLYDVPKSTPIAIAIIALLTLAFIVSAVSGVHRGVQYLSNLNMVLAVALLFFLFVVGPTVFVLSTFTESVGDYFAQIVPMSFRAGAFGGQDWLGGWTIFYWAWWMSWTPFVGAFIARISRGRTIREFVFGVVLAPSLVTFVWFSILGGISINLQLGGVNLAGALEQGQETALFELLRQYPWFALTASVVILLVAFFFVSGADAASLVMAMLSCRGCREPRNLVTIFWGVMTGAVAGILLLAGGLSALQTLCILAAFPFMFVMIGAAVSLVKELRNEPDPAPRPGRRTISTTVEELDDKALSAPANGSTPETSPTPVG